MSKIDFSESEIKRREQLKGSIGLENFSTACKNIFVRAAPVLQAVFPSLNKWLFSHQTTQNNISSSKDNI